MKNRFSSADYTDIIVGILLAAAVAAAPKGVFAAAKVMCGLQIHPSAGKTEY